MSQPGQSRRPGRIAKAARGHAAPVSQHHAGRDPASRSARTPRRATGPRCRAAGPAARQARRPAGLWVRRNVPRTATARPCPGRTAVYRQPASARRGAASCANPVMAGISHSTHDRVKCCTPMHTSPPSMMARRTGRRRGERHHRASMVHPRSGRTLRMPRATRDDGARPSRPVFGEPHQQAALGAARRVRARADLGGAAQRRRVVRHGDLPYAIRFSPRPDTL